MLKPVLQPRRPTEPEYLSVTQLNNQVKTLLEGQLGPVLIQGEISNFIAARSGHWYFTLKDSNAQVKCTMWRGRNQHLRFQPQDGMLVYARVKVTLYEVRGDYQLAVDFMEPAGLGDLQMQFEQLKEKLAQQGLFAPESKKAIPKNPSRVGVITSPSGAAIKDVLTVMQRRFPLTEVIIYPCLVQGKTAHKSIIEAIELANSRNEVDLLLITRGGGSLEDLWCFNDESLAYAIAQSKLPTLSAVGHEVDFTISDFVADLRAPTPSAAAEIVTPDGVQQAQKLDELAFELLQTIDSLIAEKQTELDFLKLRLSDPDPLLSNYLSAIADLAKRLKFNLLEKISDSRHQLHDLQLRLAKSHPEKALQATESRNSALKHRLKTAIQTYLKQQTQKLLSQVAQLNAYSPLATLERGYSITLKNQKILRNSQELQPEDEIETRLARGKVYSKVTKVEL